MISETKPPFLRYKNRQHLHLTPYTIKSLEDALHRLSKVDPPKGFVKQAKNRLMFQVEMRENETFFMSFLAKLGVPRPSEAFLSQARVRLMNRILTDVPFRKWRGAFLFAKRALASTLVMVIAVMSTLLFVDSGTLVVASQDTYLEVLSGSIHVKHADQLVWNEMTGRVDLAAGDLVRTKAGDTAVIRFFDDTEIRLSENSLLLLSQLAVSPVYSQQGVIEVALHEGEAWVQTLNVEDGYAGLTFTTRDVLLSALNATFDVRSSLEISTEVAVFDGRLNAKTLRADTREAVETLRLSANRLLQVTSGQAPIATHTALTEKEQARSWVQDNLKRDSLHLAELRERGLERLRQTAGILPGEALYPVKQAKERLRLALNFNHSNELSLQVEIANKRLNEAIVLLENGYDEKAAEALLEYQNLARQILTEAAKSDTSKEVAQRIITPHQKTLVASLPAAGSVGIVKEALSQTAELLSEDPLQKSMVSLEEGIDQLHDAVALLNQGDLEAAEKALTAHALARNDVFQALENVGDETVKKETLAAVLDIHHEELRLMEELSQQLVLFGSETQTITDMIAQAQVDTLEAAEQTKSMITPLELVSEIQPALQLSAQEQRLAAFVDKVHIYESWQGQKNQIARLLKYEGENVNNIEFLYALRSQLDQRAADLINAKILTLESKARAQKDKAVQRKIDRSVRLRGE